MGARIRVNTEQIIQRLARDIIIEEKPSQHQDKITIINYGQDSGPFMFDQNLENSQRQDNNIQMPQNLNESGNQYLNHSQGSQNKTNHDLDAEQQQAQKNSPGLNYL